MVRLQGFKLNFFGSAFMWCYLRLKYFTKLNEIWDFCRIYLWSYLAVKGLRYQNIRFCDRDLGCDIFNARCIFDWFNSYNLKQYLLSKLQRFFLGVIICKMYS